MVSRQEYESEFARQCAYMWAKMQSEYRKEMRFARTVAVLAAGFIFAFVCGGAYVLKGPFYAAIGFLPALLGAWGAFGMIPTPDPPKWPNAIDRVSRHWKRNGFEPPATLVEKSGAADPARC